MKKTIKRSVIYVALCMIIMSLGCTNKQEKDTETVNVVQEKDETIDVYGEVVVEKSKEIVIDFPATVEKIHVKEGEKVEKGTPIMTLDIKQYEMLMNFKENEIKIYETQLKALKENINPISSEINRIKEELAIKNKYIETNADPDMQILLTSLDIATMDLEEIQKEYKKNQELFNIGAISQKTLEDLEHKINLIQKEKNDITTRIEQLKTNKQLEISRLTSQLKINQGQLTNEDRVQQVNIEELNIRIQTVKLELEEMKNKLKKSYIKENTIIAEEDNLIIYDIECMEGSKVQGSILKTMDVDTIMVSVDIPEEYLKDIGIGNKVEIELYTDNQSEIIGKIIRISDMAIEKNGEIIINAGVSIEQGVEILKPGLTIDAKIYIHTR